MLVAHRCPGEGFFFFLRGGERKSESVLTKRKTPAGNLSRKFNLHNVLILVLATKKGAIFHRTLHVDEKSPSMLPVSFFSMF